MEQEGGRPPRGYADKEDEPSGETAGEPGPNSPACSTSPPLAFVPAGHCVRELLLVATLILGQKASERA